MHPESSLQIATKERIVYAERLADVSCWRISQREYRIKYHAKGGAMCMDHLLDCGAWVMPVSDAAAG